MAYHPDLNTDPSDGVIRIGWLDRRQPFNQGITDPRFVEKLALHYQHRVRQSRGLHPCPFCKERRFGLLVELNGRTFTLGSAEIEIKDHQGRVFRAPDLLYHYITEHNYLPPPEFIKAVCE